MPTNTQQSTTGALLPPAFDEPSKRVGNISGKAWRAELILSQTGRFRPLIEEYLATVAPKNYKAKDVSTVRVSIGMLFRYIVQDLHIDDLDLVRPSTITRYIDSRRALGYLSFTFLGHIASFFSWLAYRGDYDRGNPVIRRFHRERMSAPLDLSGLTDNISNQIRNRERETCKN